MRGEIESGMKDELSRFVDIHEWPVSARTAALYTGFHMINVFLKSIAGLEKPAGDDVTDVAERILNDCDGTRDTLSLCANYLQQYAESYHAKKQQESCRRCLTELDEIDRAEILASLPEAPNA